jgi:hypothetical protein
MGDLALVVVGAALATLGWYWGGVADSRTSSVALGAAAAILLGTTVFAAAGTAPALPVWALAGVTGAWAGLIAAVVRWEIGGDRTLGLFSLFVALAGVLSAAGLIRDADGLTTTALGALAVAVAAVLLFVSGALIPAVRGFRSFVGWVVLLLGAVTAVLGYGASLGFSF